MNNFNFIKFFDENDIKYKTSGKNIGGNGWIGIETCPRCGKDNYHAAANEKTGKLNCWGCGGFNLNEFIKLTLKCDYRKLNKVLKQYELEPQEILNNIEEQENQEEKQNTVLKFPSTFTSILPKEAKDYLEKRRFSFLEIQKKYDVMWSGTTGRNKFRIIWPVYENNKLVNYIGNSIINGKNIIPYQFCLDDEAVTRRRDLIFNLDNCNSDKVILVEGLMNSCRLGDGTAALLSVNFSKSQIIKLRDKGFKKFYLGFDNDDPGRRASKRLESQLVFADEINYIEYGKENSDIADLCDEDVKLIRRMIF
ncbi:MAG: toprim domain-containing protein [Melioribacteraceae bacterium]